MKNFISLTIIAAAAIVAIACTNKKQETENEQKALVLYYSQTGTTKAVAEEIQRQMCADIEAITSEKPYEGGIMEVMSRVQQESADQLLLNPLSSNIADYDVIFLGYPIWGGTYALPISALLLNQDFAGKTIVPFCTFGSGGIDESTTQLKSALPKADVKVGYGVRAARTAAIPTEVNRFLIENGWKKGEVEQLPDYSEQVPVTESETEIFNIACGDYQFPLGTPISFGKRETSTSTDYLFMVKSMSMSGEEAQSVIYVTVGKDEGAKPEFTKVVR